MRITFLVTGLLFASCAISPTTTSEDGNPADVDARGTVVHTRQAPGTPGNVGPTRSAMGAGIVGGLGGETAGGAGPGYGSPSGTTGQGGSMGGLGASIRGSGSTSTGTGWTARGIPLGPAPPPAPKPVPPDVAE
jgi:hypothetical protein